MKTILLICLSLCLFSCTTEPTVVGKWKLTAIDYTDFINDSPTEMQKSLKKQLDQQLKILLQHTFFDLKKNNQLELTYPNDENLTIEGRWSLSSKNDSLYLAKEDAEKYKIEKLTNQFLVLSTKDAPKRTLSFEIVE
jgi:hypothetical protein